MIDPNNLFMSAAVLTASAFFFRVYYSSVTLKGQDSFKRGFILFLRILVCVLLILALFDFEMPLNRSGNNLIIAVDNSWSMKDNVPEAMRAADMIVNRISAANKGVKTGVQYMSFASKCGLEKSFKDAGDFFISAPRVVTENSLTNIEKALTFCSALLDDGAGNKIVLFTDGDENSGELKKSAARLKQMGVEVYPYYFERNFNYDVILTSAKLPANIVAGQKFEGGAVLELKGADSLNDVEFRVYRNEVLVKNARVNLVKGLNTFNFYDKIDICGFSKYTIYAEHTLDKNPHNNTMYAHTEVNGEPNILIVSQKEKARAVNGIFSKLGHKIAVIEPSELTGAIEGLIKYRLIVLNDVSSRLISKTALAGLKNYVTEIGGGLLMLGGPDSYGNGGYKATPLEDLSPYNMDVTDKAKIVSCSIIFVIDKSGSMGEFSTGYDSDRMQKIDIAKEAVIKSVDLLFDKDMIGVIVFDEDAKWVIMPVSGREKGTVISEVSKIYAGGGTSMYGALSEAFNEIKKQNTTTKHIIALTDGITAKSDFNKLVKEFEVEKVTLTTVALGRDADVPFLSGLSEIGKGRFYFCEEAAGLPSIFVQETLKSSRRLIVEEKFTPSVVTVPPLFSNIQPDAMASMPSLYGYVSATIKPNAVLHLKSKRDDPLIASFICGLGRCAGVTFDFYGKWGAEFIEWAGFYGFLKNSVKYLLRDEFSPNISFSAVKKGDILNLTFKSYDARKNYLNFLDSRLSVTRPDGAAETLEISQTGVGIYQADFKLNQEGNYFFSITQKDKDGKVYHSVFGYSYPYSAEYAPGGAGESKMRDLAAATGGNVIQHKKTADLPENLLSFASKNIYKKVKIRDYLIELAIFLFLFEIFLWRVDISFLLFVKLRNYLIAAAGALKGGADAGSGYEKSRPENMSKLLAAKSVVTGRKSAAKKENFDNFNENLTNNVEKYGKIEISNVENSGKNLSSASEKKETGAGGKPESNEGGSFTGRLLKIKRKK